MHKGAIMNIRSSLFIPLVLLVLSAGSGNFVNDVLAIAASAPDNSEPVDVESLTASTPENTEPQEVS